jgi:hypothetical protein
MEMSGQLHAPVPGTHCIAGWVGPRAGLEAVERKILHCREWNPGRPAGSPSLYRLSYPGSSATELVTIIHKFSLAYPTSNVMLLYAQIE